MLRAYQLPTSSCCAHSRPTPATASTAEATGAVTRTAQQQAHRGGTRGGTRVPQAGPPRYSGVPQGTNLATGTHGALQRTSRCGSRHPASVGVVFDNTSGCLSNTSSSLARSASVICRDAPRAWWAVKTPPKDSPSGIGGALECSITKYITTCDDAVELANVYMYTVQ
jgi:hypothetical protein